MLPTFDLALSHVKVVSSAQLSQENRPERKRRLPGWRQQQPAAGGDCHHPWELAGEEAQKSPALRGKAEGVWSRYIKDQGTKSCCVKRDGSHIGVRSKLTSYRPIDLNYLNRLCISRDGNLTKQTA